MPESPQSGEVTPAADAPVDGAVPPRIPDHELVRCVGRGSFGEVWLARNVMGTYRAVKIVSRKSFSTDRPFDREFLGIQKFEPVSRTHPGLVTVLHVGRNAAEGYFYYVMEVADDAVTGQDIHPDRYRPKTLSDELIQYGRIGLREGLRLGLALTDALGHLHRQGLIHRDIKPSNIIYVNGAPKFADIGLVTNIGQAGTYIGTAGYIPPEGPGLPSGDIFSLGRTLEEACFGQTGSTPADQPTRVESEPDDAILAAFKKVIQKACDPDCRKRYDLAEEMHSALAAVESGTPASDFASPTRPRTTGAGTGSGLSAYPPLPKPLRVAILAKPKAQPDSQVLQLLADRLTAWGCQVFYDQHHTFGLDWAREIESKIRDSDAAIVLLSSASIHSEMIAFEVEMVCQAQHQEKDRPLLLPVRLQWTQPLEDPLASLLDRRPQFTWNGPQDDERLVRELVQALAPSPQPAPPAAPVKLEPVGGAVPLDSQFYVVRATDHQFQEAIHQKETIVLIKGARQMGKTSLLARGLQQARQAGAKVVLTDFQKLNTSHFANVDVFFLTLANFLADQLDLDAHPEDAWDSRRGANTNFERFIRREILNAITTHFVWGMDEVDRLFTCDFGSEVFGLIRSWHNERALDPSGPWSRLTLAIAYATEAHLFITDVNQSPFNVGTTLALEDFSLDHVADLNQRHGSPLRTPEDLRQFYNLVGGHPYLVRRGLREIASGNLSLAQFMDNAARDDGLFGDHLRRILLLLSKDPELTEVVRRVLRKQSCPNATSFYRLRSAGVMAGDSPQNIQPRCDIYATYLKQALLSTSGA